MKITRKPYNISVCIWYIYITIYEFIHMYISYICTYTFIHIYIFIYCVLPIAYIYIYMYPIYCTYTCAYIYIYIYMRDHTLDVAHHTASHAHICACVSTSSFADTHHRSCWTNITRTNAPPKFSLRIAYNVHDYLVICIYIYMYIHVNVYIYIYIVCLFCR